MKATTTSGNGSSKQMIGLGGILRNLTHEILRQRKEVSDLV
jgi:hypothetical protein